LTRKTLAGINPNLAVVKFQTFQDQISDQFSGERLTSRMILLFGALSLLLATIGIYGVTAYSVARRSREIGIRMALGADRRIVISRVLGGAVKQTSLGLALGTPVALVCVRFVKSQLYEITNVDLNVLAGSVAVLTLAALVATIIPARRAASINPIDTLRLE
jgi:ABC-type antimicrobial peptide transport system permease subunit